MPAAGRGRTQRQTPIEIPKVEIPRHRGRSAIKAEERRRNIENAKTPFVPPAPTSSSSTRPGGRARVSGGIQIGVPQSSPISTQRPNRSSSTTTETPTKNPERVTQATGGVPVPAFSYYDQARKDNPDGGTRNFGEGYKEAELEAGQIAENSRAGAGFGGQTRVSPTGVVQKGTSTSPKPMTMDDANKLLTGGYKMNQDYASNQLPYTQSSPYAGKGNAEIYNPEMLLQHQQGPGAPDYVKLSKDIYGDQSGVESYTRSGEMNKDYEQMDVDLGQSTAGKPEKSIPKRPSGARQAEKWDRKYGGADFSGKSEAPATSGFDMERRAAFLGAKTSMEGLRRSEATQNMAERNGDYFIGDGKGGENLIKLENKEDRLTYKSGPEGAREIRDKYVNALTSKGETPAPLPDSEQAAGNVEASTGQKPLTVAPSDIPSDLSGAAGEEYLRKLDAGLLTKNR